MKETAYKKYLLTILLVILAFNYVDRLALGVALQDIKGTLRLSDTQLGFLSGIAFALFYSTMGIPIARWADRGDRVRIITITIALWSATVALCGVAQSYLQLLLIRIGVAVGEAGCIPPAHSLIADHFTRAERPRAVGTYMLGASLSVVVGYFLAGWLNQFYGWRWMFVILGLPGLGLAGLTALTLREPRRQVPTTDAGIAGGTHRLGVDSLRAASPPTLAKVWMTLWGRKTFRHLLMSFSVIYFFGYGILQWQPAFFVRSYGLKTGELGTWFALIYGVVGVVGTYVGGELASRHAAHNEQLQLRVISVMYSSYGAISALIYLAPNHFLAFALMGLATLGGAAVSGPLFATIQTLVPQRMRATSVAIIYLFANLIGMGLGPLMAGALSDMLRPSFGDESLRYALLALCPGYVWGAWHVWLASRTVAADLKAVESEREQAASARSAVVGV